uniref:Uncharacterized protein n=1 Tax=Daphnia galeata TaxID=27404 RepID=A0A8J2RJB4_9CRUS|nr:unnamed protein product [Daphnia galeata]
MFVNFKSARQQLALAVEQTDLSGEEEAAAEQGRGKRPKRAPARYGQSSMEESNQDASHMLANCPSFPNNTKGFYTSTQYSPSGIDSSQSSNLPRHSNDAAQPPAGVSTPRFVLCQQDSESMEFGSASVGVGEDSQLDSQLIGSPSLIDNVDIEPIDNLGAVNRRPLPTVAKRLPFPSTDSRPSATSVASRPVTTGVVSRPSTSANTIQRFSSGVSSQPTSANNRQLVIPAVDWQQEFESMDFGSAFVGVGEDSQLDSQLNGSPTLSDNVDSEPIDNPGAVNRRPLSAGAKRLPFPSNTSRPSATSVASRPATTGVSTQHTSANNRQFFIQAVDNRPQLAGRQTTSAGIGDEASGENRPVLMATDELLTKICVSKADSNTEGSKTLYEIPISSVETF